jgi:hypothetical protein
MMQILTSFFVAVAILLGALSPAFATAEVHARHHGHGEVCISSVDSVDVVSDLVPTYGESEAESFARLTKPLYRLMVMQKSPPVLLSSLRLCPVTVSARTIDAARFLRDCHLTV